MPAAVSSRRAPGRAPVSFADDAGPAPAAARGEDSRNPGIDALRGLYILLVVVHHVALRIPLKQTALADVLPARLLAALNWNGWSAVFVFFVVSGFLIAGHSIRRWGSLERPDFRAFYARRAARILPLLFALLVVLSLLHLAGAGDYVIHGEGQSLGRALVAVLGLHLNWYEGTTGWLPGNWDVLWSLSIEEVFYLGFPLACALLRGERRILAATTLFALALPVFLARLEGANEIWQEKAYLPGMAAIAAGVAAAIIAARKAPRPSTARWLCVGGGFGVLAALLWGPWLWRSFGNGTMLVLTLSTAALLVGLQWRRRHAPRAGGMRGLGWLRAQGRLSYEIYLTHMFVVYAVVGAFEATGGDLRGGWMWFVPAVFACWALGAVVERAVTTPAGRWMLRRSRTDVETVHPRQGEVAGQ
jgi:peptidoglycan/LPS O-acetylase OafA/YrhL